MAIDDTPESKDVSMQPDGASHTQKFIALFVILAFLAVGEIYTLSQITSSRHALQTEVQKVRQEMSTQLNQSMVAVKESNTQQLQALEEELDQASKRLGSTGRELKRARTMVTSLQDDQKKQAEELRQEIALKADQQQLGAISQDVNATRTDLDSTKTTLNDAIEKLGMTRSEFGNLIARNHDEIEALRKLGDRDYIEFVLERKVPKQVAGVGLIFQKANVKRNRFNLTLLADDLSIEKKDRTVNEPVYFYVGGSKRVYELVVNKVESKRVKGYISTPKGATQLAQRAEGAL
jgi:predicted  nucleic acid-binding Zn-ribbon protein